MFLSCHRFNFKWNETQFAIESRSQNETASVDKFILHPARLFIQKVRSRLAFSLHCWFVNYLFESMIFYYDSNFLYF